MAENVEMDDLVRDDSNRRLLESPEVAVVQPHEGKRRESDSSQEREERQKQAPSEVEELIKPVEAKSKRRVLHCAGQSALDCYRDYSSTDSDDSFDEGMTAMPAIERRFDEVIEDSPSVISEAMTAMPALRARPAVASRYRPIVEEYFIIPEKTDGNVNRQEDLKEEDERLSLQDRTDLEERLDETLKAGDLDDISEWITPQHLTKCATNCLEKSLQVSHELKSLADAKGPDADDLSTLAASVEDFAVQLLEPLKSDDMKRAIFEGGFDRVSDKAVKCRQKKFLSHPVVYNLLTRKQWTGYFDQTRHSNVWFIWFLLNIWTFLDVFLFPLVHFVLGMIHLIIEFAKKRKELRVVLLFNASSKHARAQFPAMRTTARCIMHNMKSERFQCATITRDSNGPIVTEFSEDASQSMPNSKDVTYPKSEVGKNKDLKEDLGFLDCLKKAKNLFEETEESKKVLVVITDDKVGAPSNKLLRAVTSLKQQNVRIISVGFGVHPDIKELEAMATSDENVVLIFDDDIKKEEAKNNNILECIKGKDIFDRYTQYFTTPYFIFFRDTLSYLALLGLHFAVCLQPSTIHFTPVEWIILVFFVGRLMMEINQIIREKNSNLIENHDLLQQNKTKDKPEDKTDGSSTSAKREEEEESDDQGGNSKKTQELKKIRKIISCYFDDWWNILDVVTLMVFLILLGIRIFIWSQHSSVPKNRLLAVAAYLYGLNAMFLTLRVFGHIMEFKKSTGSIQIALFQIITAVIAIFGQFFAATVAFSLAITKIYVAEVSYNSGVNGTPSGSCESQNGLKCWWKFTTHLTWSLLGIAELTPLESSDSASDSLAKLLYGLFLIMGVVMLMNMMIALLSNTYQHVEDNAFYEWSYKKATTIRTYKKYHPVPVPFNIISLSYILLRHICRMIKSIKCKKKPRHRAMLSITGVPESHMDMMKMQQRQTIMERKTLFELLIDDLKAEYFAVHGYAFPMADDNKMDRVLKETEGCHQLIGHIAHRVFRYDQAEKSLLKLAHEYPDWDTKGISVDGQQLLHVPCRCSTCDFNDEMKYHGARYLNALSERYPEFEVLIQESGERRIVAIGVVTQNYGLHKFPGWEGNTAGYHIDDGRIFDSAHSKLGKEGDDAMAFRGDLIGCKLLYDQQKDNKLPVSFTLNGRVVGEAKLSYYGSYSSSFYPFVGIGCKGISLVFRMCPQVNLVQVDTDRVFQMLENISGQLQQMNERQALLERKLEYLSASLAVKGEAMSGYQI